MRDQPLSTSAAIGTALALVGLWTTGLLGEGLTVEVARAVDLGALPAWLWRATCLGAGVAVVLASRPAVRRLDPNARAGAAALLLQLGGVGLVLLASVPEGARPGEASGSWETVALLCLGALVPAAGFLLAARWRREPVMRTETVVGFVASTVALWAMLLASGQGDWTGLAQRVALTAALGWMAWLFTRSLDPDARSVRG
ncbi:hypothetical protein GCM10009821_06370 [Aeromicrobium halocynthiae]|uniref:DUF998 domain-containing protein n=1 Tax=Aeromicrobium halocynthiae TaxID=560557 RepID=A0ABN2VST6_9ACTN